MPSKFPLGGQMTIDMPQDKQLRSVNLDEVVEKRRLDQALNAKEFAVLAGISYSTAREWFRLPEFPVIQGVVFWVDFVQWRTSRVGFKNLPLPPPYFKTNAANLPPRAAKILLEA